MSLARLSSKVNGLLGWHDALVVRQWLAGSLSQVRGVTTTSTDTCVHRPSLSLVSHLLFLLPPPHYLGSSLLFLTSTDSCQSLSFLLLAWPGYSSSSGSIYPGQKQTTGSLVASD